MKSVYLFLFQALTRLIVQGQWPKEVENDE